MDGYETPSIKAVFYNVYFTERRAQFKLYIECFKFIVMETLKY